MGFFKKLFGGDTSEEPREVTDEERAKIRSSAVQGLEDVEGAENIKVHGEGEGSRVIRSSDGADLVEDDGERLWVDRHDSEVTPQAWRDDWGPLRGKTADTLPTFLFHEQKFNMAQQGDADEAEQALKGLGYKSVGQFFRVRLTAVKHYATAHGPTLDQYVFDSQEVMSASMKASQMSHQQTMQQTTAQNPQLLEPVEGVSVELYAQIASKIAMGGLSQDGMAQLLAQHKLDYAAWDKAQKVWTDRMSKDTTATIATIYGKAFQQSGQGQYGAAAQAAAATGYDGTAAAGAEPIPFRTLCEIQGAMTAWSQSGQDVNALLKKHFNMNAMDWSNASTWWMTKMMADVSKFDEYNKTCEAFQMKWRTLTPRGGGDDIKF
jgi:hypothetical protein